MYIGIRAAVYLHCSSVQYIRIECIYSVLNHRVKKFGSIFTHSGARVLPFRSRVLEGNIAVT